MYRFYVSKEQIRDGNIVITGGDVNHIRNVLRLEPGDWLAVCDGAGTDYVSRIMEIKKEEVILMIEKTQVTGTELPAKITLFQGIPKKDKMDLIVQKTVELGVFQIVPVQMKRSVVKLVDEKKIQKRKERWQAIAEAAAKQSDRGIVPEVLSPVSMDAAIDMAGKFDYNMIPYELQEGMECSREIVKEACRQKSIGIFIGPEGGFEKEEVDKAVSCGIHPISLGKRILRTETAGMALLSVLMFLMQQ